MGARTGTGRGSGSGSQAGGGGSVWVQTWQMWFPVSEVLQGLIGGTVVVVRVLGTARVPPSPLAIGLLHSAFTWSRHCL